MAIPTFVQAGAGNGTATLASAISLARPVGVTLGNLLITAIEPTNTNGNAAATITSANWTQFTGSPFAGTNNRLVLYWKIATATDISGGSISITGTGGTTADGLFARMFEFNSATGWDTNPVQAIGTALSGTTTTSPIGCPSVTTPVNDCLAVMASVLNDDAGNPASATGATGGTWTQAVAEYENASGSGGTIDLQTAPMATAGTISGGSFAYGASGDNYVTVAFALVPFAGPVLSSIDTDNDTVDTRTGVVIAGSQFGASETGSAKVEVSNNATYGSGTVVEVDVTSWSATSITVTLRRESDSAALAGLLTLPLAPAYLWVTNSAGLRNIAGFQFTLRPPGPTAMAAVNTTPEIPLNTTKLLRARIENSGGAGVTSFRWAYSLSGGAWTPITISSSVIRAVAASSFANDEDVPQVIGGSGTYITANDAATEDGTTTLPANFAAGGAIEFVLAFQRLDPGPIQIRLELGDGTAFTTYTNVPSLEALAAVVDLAASLAALSAISASFNCRRRLAASAPAISTVATTLGRRRPFASSTAAISASSAQLRRSQRFAAALAAVSTGTVALGRRRPLASVTASLSAIAATSLRRQARLTASLESASAVATSLSARRLLPSTLAAASSVTLSELAITGLALFEATLTSTSAVAATLRRRAGIAADLASASAIASALGRRRLVATALVTTSDAAAALAVRRPMAAILASTSAITAETTVAGVATFAATLASTSSIQAALAARRAIPAAMASQSAAIAALSARRAIPAALASASIITAHAAARRPLAASMAAASVAAAVLARRAGLSISLESQSVLVATALRRRAGLAVGTASASAISATLALIDFIELYPDAVLVGTNLQDSALTAPPVLLTDLDDDPTSPDPQWWTAINPNLGIEARVGLPAPQGLLRGTQRVRVLLRRAS